MSLCVTTQLVYVPYTNAATPRYATNVLIPIANPPDPSTCSALLLSGAEYSTLLDAQTNFGWNEESFNVAIEGGLLFFVVGISIGIIINVVKRARSP